MRRETADAIMHVAREQPPIDARLLGIELRRVGRAFVVLRAAGETPLLELASALTIKLAPSAASRSCSSPAVSSGPIATRASRQTGPVSSPSSMRMIETPVSLSPAMMARLMGAAPRQCGRSEAWTLKQPKRGASRIGLGQDQPIGDDDRGIGIESAEALLLLRALQAALALHRKAASSAAWCTGDLRKAMPRPAARGGWV